MAKPTVAIIRGGRLLDSRAHAAPKRDMLIEGDTIAEIGRPGMAAPPTATVIDARGRLLHPGLINGHTHSHGNLAKGMVDRVTLELLLTAGSWMSGQRTLEDKYLSSLIGASEMVLKGCTAAYDLTGEFPMPSVEGLAAVGQAYADVGMRAVLAPMVADLSFFEALPGLMERLPAGLRKDVERFALAPYKGSVARMRKAMHGWKLAGKDVQLAVAPTIPHHCSREFLLACLRLSRDYDTGLHTHVAESKVQVIAGYKLYGSTLTAYLDRLGLVGPSFTVAHGVWLDGDDMRLLGDRGASVSHNPGSNMRLGNGIADMRAMLEAGINVGIGTDGASCSDNQNMYENMRLASMVSKAQGPDWQRWISTEEVFDAATVGSAGALGLGDRIGRLEKGYKADIVFLDLGHVNWIPCNDPTNQIVHTEDGTAVHSVMIGGRMVVENRKLLTVDLAELARKAEKARARLEAANRSARALYDKLEKIVGTFCPGLAKEPLHIDRFAGGHHCHIGEHRPGART
ncbi:amidohydrolase [Reyranella sp.]|jgi:guanine deaminase|uniref:amidohydrolase family protein n=1 Tax=Reyranella sp. TaxID=1929291 RepID=UPI002F9243A6